jgi:2-polyprenyl-3-methyl-5-hydroxy-6-metoxy-1,4-benzoquinol methylase
MKTRKHNVDVFSQDAEEYGGYLYYSEEKLSSFLANERILKGMAKVYDFHGVRLLELGCGDGTSTLDMLSLGAAFIHGVDAAPGAIAVAGKKADKLGLSGKCSFSVGDLYTEKIDGTYDCVVFSRVLHHLPDPEKAVARAAQWSNNVLIIEPNGNNPVLKIIEKCSRYHREHEEQSFSTRLIRQWLETAGFGVTAHAYVNLVPMFCPDWMARLCKFAEPLVENLPFIRAVCCGQYIVLASAKR